LPMSQSRSEIPTRKKSFGVKGPEDGYPAA
jgi:hypothetical protein